MAVDTAWRRRGLATRLLVEALRLAEADGATRAYLQVEPDNEPALRPYHGLGFTAHHEYRYHCPA